VDIRISSNKNGGRMKNILGCCLIFFTLLTNSYAMSSYDFTDTSTTWPGYESMAYKDVHGVPNILGGTFLFSGHNLTGISLQYQYDASALNAWNMFNPGDWFLDINADNVWDYVINSENTRKSGEWDIYKVAIGLSEKSKYIMSLDITKTGASIRKDHPIEAKESLLKSKNDIGDAAFSGWMNSKPSASETYSVYWDFSDTPIFLGDNGGKFTYGFAVSCANDVLYGSAPIPTPEPGSILLLATGLVPLAIRYRKKLLR